MRFHRFITRFLKHVSIKFDVHILNFAFPDSTRIDQIFLHTGRQMSDILFGKYAFIL